MGMNFADRGANRRRSCSRLTRLHKTLIAVFGFLLITYYLTPLDSPTRSFFRFTSNNIEDYRQTTFTDGSWALGKQKYPVNPAEDIGIVLKTGFGTRKRVEPALEALSNETLFTDIVVVQDFPKIREQEGYNMTNGRKVDAVNIIDWNIKRGAMNGTEHLERMSKFRHLNDAVAAEEWVLAEGVGQEIGWELDAMKFLPSLEYAWLNMPKKKWYLLLDDDTYVIKSSLMLLLNQLNPAKPTYIGNPVGDYKGRFPHGGSSVIISGSAVSKLYDGHPDIVAAGHLESPGAIWGDKLLSTTLMKVGVYLDEKYQRLFNGESPWNTRMWADRLCLPLISFHTLGTREKMEDVGERFADVQEPVFWRQLADYYGATPDFFASFHKNPIWANMDFVGRGDEHSQTFSGVDDVVECIRICGRHKKSCLAWTHDPARQLCHIAPWATVGEHIEGVYSGVNAPLAEWLIKKCPSTPSTPPA